MFTLISGSRSINDYELVSDILSKANITHIIHGGAKGVDSLAQKYAEENNIPTTIYPANWKKYSKKAGYIRNEEMAKEVVKNSGCSIVIWDGESKGSYHQYKINKEIYRIPTELVNIKHFNKEFWNMIYE